VNRPRAAASRSRRLQRALGGVSLVASLAEQLGRLRQEWRERASPADRRTLEEALARLEMLQLAENGLRSEDVLPDFALPDSTGTVHRSEDLLARGPLVLAFFRGGWYPYCDAAMRVLEGARPAIDALGASVVGILPEKQERLARTTADKRLGFVLLSDIGGKYARMCGLEFELMATHQELYRRIGIDIEGNNAGAGWALPLPASYVVGRDGVVRWAFIEHDYAKRADPADLIDAVRRLSQAAD
jgi:peroxiredoxin